MNVEVSDKVYNCLQLMSQSFGVPMDAVIRQGLVELWDKNMEKMQAETNRMTKELESLAKELKLRLMP